MSIQGYCIFYMLGTTESHNKASPAGRTMHSIHSSEFSLASSDWAKYKEVLLQYGLTWAYHR